MQELENSPALASVNRISTPLTTEPVPQMDPKPDHQPFNSFYPDYNHSYYDNPSASVDPNKTVRAVAAALQHHYQTYSNQPSSAQQSFADYQYHHYNNQHNQQSRPILNWNLTPPSSSSSKNSSPSTSNGNTSSGDCYEYYSGCQSEIMSAPSTIGDPTVGSKSIFSTICSNENNFFAFKPNPATNHCYTNSYAYSQPSYQSQFAGNSVVSSLLKTSNDESRKSPGSIESSSGGQAECKSSVSSSTSSLFMSSPTSIHSTEPHKHTNPIQQQKQHQNLSISSTSTPTSASSSALSSLSLSSNSENKQGQLMTECFDWMKPGKSQSNGKTRTKDKYRIVYSDFQRRELEKEFMMVGKYITIKRKSELSQQLKLSERQIKIWFQNRRAKDRKTSRKQKLDTNVSSTTRHDRLNEDRKQHSDFSGDEEDEESDLDDEDVDDVENHPSQIKEENENQVSVSMPVSSSSPQVAESATKPSTSKSKSKKTSKSLGGKNSSSTKTDVSTAPNDQHPMFLSSEPFANPIHHPPYPYQYSILDQQQTVSSSNQFYANYTQNNSTYPSSTYQHHQSFGFAQPDYSSAVNYQHNPDYTNHQQMTSANYFQNDYLTNKSFMSQLAGKSSFPNASTPATSASLVANVLSQFQPV